MIKRFAPVATPVSFKELCFSGLKLSGGNEDIKKFENLFSKKIGVRHSIALSLGRAGLYVILKALNKITKKNEVIIPAYTCPSVAASIVKAGLKVVLCDISESTFGYDLERLAKLIGEDTLAVVCVHLFGIPVDIEQVLKKTQDNGIYIIEDSAQFAKTANNGHGCLKGDIAFYSLGRGKNITTGGGGFIATDNKESADNIRYMLKNNSRISSFNSFFKLFAYTIFINPLLYFIPQNLPFLKLGETIYSTDFKVLDLSPFQARFGISMLEKLNEINSSRREKALFYRKELINVKGIFVIDDRDESIYLRFPIFINDEKSREAIYEEVSRKGLGVTKMYPEPLSEIEELKPHLTNIESYPNAERISKSILTLPTHYLVNEKDIFKIVDVIKRHINEN